MILIDNFKLIKTEFMLCKDKKVLLEILKQKPDLNISIDDDYNIIDDYGFTTLMYAFKYCNDK